MQLTLPRLDLPRAPFDSKSEHREEIAGSLCTDGTAPLEMPEENEGIHPTLQDLVNQQERALGSQPVHLVIFTCKDTTASGSEDYQLKMLSFEPYIYIKARLVQKSNELVQNLTN